MTQCLICLDTPPYGNCHGAGCAKADRPDVADIVEALRAADRDLRSHNVHQSTLNLISGLLLKLGADQ